MKKHTSAAIGSLSLVLMAASLSGVAFAQQTNEQARQDAQAQARENHSTDKAQTKADKAEYKAAKSHKVKKAAKEQDKADAKAAQSGTLPPSQQ